ncbi:MAG: sensor histidine kinase [Candidatus Limnocylindria bacterium]
MRPPPPGDDYPPRTSTSAADHDETRHAAEAEDLDHQFDAIVAGLRRDVRRLRQQVERFARGYQKRAEALSRRPADQAPRTDEATQLAHRRLRQLELVVTHLESSAAYLLGSGLAPGEADGDERLDVAQRVLESLEAERERLYRDVHDGPAQVLANAIFEVEYLERIVERAPVETRGPLRAELTNLKGQFRSSLEAVRQMIYDLRPPVLSELGLAGALRTYAAEYQERNGLVVSCRLDDGDTGLTAPQELAVYRVMQEALQNTHKHARASAVGIDWVRAEDGGWALRCNDDGVGFDLVRAARRPRSVGLLSMRERAELIGGSLQIRSAPGQGTTVTLQLPATKESGALG